MAGVPVSKDQLRSQRMEGKVTFRAVCSSGQFNWGETLHCHHPARAPENS
jgi:hypothetical protein